ncbi:MAG TPA: T9SS type A sorting domain-containing protein, partial [Cytophagales bacterium]|nr:T9SS type A sorting domain-containing protein [Cytophagales bacterium]
TGNAIAKVRFYQGSLMIAEVTSAPYQANINDLAPGDYTFMAVAVSQAGCTDTAFTTVGVVTAVGDYSFEETISVFPNPYEEQVTIAMAGGFRYSLHNVNGSELKRGEGFDKISLGTELSNGIYILKLSKGDVIKILRIEKK